MSPFLEVLAYRASVGRFAVSAVDLTPEELAELASLLAPWLARTLPADVEIMEVSVSAE